MLAGLTRLYPVCKDPRDRAFLDDLTNHAEAERDKPIPPAETILLRSGRPLLTPEQLDELCDELADEHTHKEKYVDWFDQIKHIIRIQTAPNRPTPPPENSYTAAARPIKDAADEVAALAYNAKEMLLALEAGFFWQLLISKTPTDEFLRWIDPTPTKKVEPSRP
jgi:hypothetical protein